MSLEEQFHEEMIRIGKEAAFVLGRLLPKFDDMMRRYRGLGTAKRILPSCTLTFKDLCKAKRLDLTVEAVVLDVRFAELFSPGELEVARWRLDKAGYKAP